MELSTLSPTWTNPSDQQNLLDNGDLVFSVDHSSVIALKINEFMVEKSEVSPPVDICCILALVENRASVPVHLGLQSRLRNRD
jgi:hypothetical protein